MIPITAKRAEWLRVVHLLHISLGRPPWPKEIAAARGVGLRTDREVVTRASDDGHIVLVPRPSVFVGTGIRVAPRALLELQLPAVVYLAWAHHAATPMRLQAETDAINASTGGSIARHLAQLGIAVVSPCLVGIQPAGAMQSASLLAQRADAVIVWRDPLLVGRSDVAAARQAGVPITVTPAAMSGVTAADLWTAPFLLPPLPEPPK